MGSGNNPSPYYSSQYCSHGLNVQATCDTSCHFTFLQLLLQESHQIKLLLKQTWGAPLNTVTYFLECTCYLHNVCINMRSSNLTINLKIEEIISVEASPCWLGVPSNSWGIGATQISAMIITRSRCQSGSLGFNDSPNSNLHTPLWNLMKVPSSKVASPILPSHAIESFSLVTQ